MGRPTPLRLAPASLLVGWAMTLTSCASAPENATTRELPPAASGAQGASEVPFATPSPKSSAKEVVDPPPVMPAEISECVAAPESFGTWKPTPAEVVKAIEKLGPSACGSPPVRLTAVRACQSRVGSSSVKVTFGDFERGDQACTFSTLPVEFNNRRFVLGYSFFRDQATFFQESAAWELNGQAPTLYFDSGIEDFADLCDAPPPALPKKAPSDWKGLPNDLKYFFCTADTHPTSTRRKTIVPKRKAL